MSAPLATPRSRLLRYRGSRGFILALALLLLVVLTMLALAMFRGFGLQERIAGNTRDKQRAFQAAQAALRYGEWWLTQGNPGVGAPCSGTVDANNVANMRVCDAVLAHPETLPWPNQMEYLPPRMTSGTGGINSDRDINYSTKPALHIAYMGATSSSVFYQITAAGYGGNPRTISVVQSVYEMTSSTSAAP